MALLACSEHDAHEHAADSTGEQLYGLHCAGCHQGAGEGEFLKGVPPVRYTTLTYQQMVDHILGHARIEDSRMPTFSQMPRAEAEAIAVYVRQRLALF